MRLPAIGTCEAGRVSSSGERREACIERCGNLPCEHTWDSSKVRLLRPLRGLEAPGRNASAGEMAIGGGGYMLRMGARQSFVTPAPMRIDSLITRARLCSRGPFAIDSRSLDSMPSCRWILAVRITVPSPPSSPVSSCRWSTPRPGVGVEEVHYDRPSNARGSPGKNSGLLRRPVASAL